MTDSRGAPTLRVDNIAEYLILSLGLTKDAGMQAFTALNSATFEIDKVSFFVKP